MSDDVTPLAVLKLLGKGRSREFICQAMKLDPQTVTAIARTYGAVRKTGEIDAAAAAAAAAKLLQQLADAPTLEERAPRPVRESMPGKATESGGRKIPTPPTAAPARPPLAAAGPDQVLQQVPLERLKVDPANPRENVGDVGELAASMREVGLLQPIVARRTAGGQMYVVAGHRRLAAAHSLGWKSVAVVIRRDMRSDEVLAAMLIENGQRKDLDFIEEARGLARLKGQLGCTDAELARRIGRNSGHVTRRLHLLALPVEEQEALRLGEMSLQEATHKARLTSGRLPADKPRGRTYLSAAHPLAAAAKARCLRLAHSRGRGKGVGGIACGECWESVIRADERAHLHQRSGATGKCALCDHPIPTRKDLPA